MIDQKHGKGNLSPIRGQVPVIDHGRYRALRRLAVLVWLTECMVPVLPVMPNQFGYTPQASSTMLKSRGNSYNLKDTNA